MSPQRKFFPGWLVVASGLVIMATCYTIFVNCMSLFQPLIVSDLGITLAQYNVSNAISTVVSVVGSLVIGHVADKVSGRVLGSLTVIATSAVLAGMSFVGELWQVYVLFAVSGCFAVASSAHQPSDRQLVYRQTWPCHFHRTFGFGLWRSHSVSHRELAYRERWLALCVPGARCRLHGGGAAHHGLFLPHQAFRDRP